ncbi:hypothetical protein N496_19290 (plasmid) [Clostridium botulinum A2B3 87]|uniref:hypothetical protein n=1 Tax=Clostridium botulinum TaxID=1491 RepID=UPI0004A56281|nr:hypothetical protein [Clostridium botulinum]KEI95103.1 hypothetical protein N496_19290 [Clostridium botulinum A2B3 87]NFI38774.1 hypothetical protein [Clostridium botulinum]
MLLKLPKEPRLHTVNVCTNDHKEFNGAEIIGEPLAIGVKNPKSKVNTYIIKEGYTYLWETYNLYDGDKFYSIWLLYPKNNRPIEIEIEDYAEKEIIDAIKYETKIRDDYSRQAKEELKRLNFKSKEYYFEHPIISGIVPVDNQEFIDKLNGIDLKEGQKINENPPVYVKSIQEDKTIILSGYTKYNS